MVRFIVIVAVVGGTACGGGSLSRSGVRADAAKRWNCPKSDLSEQEEGPTVVRVTGCGQSGVYVCTIPRRMREVQHDPMRTKQEESRINAGARCRPALQGN